MELDAETKEINSIETILSILDGLRSNNINKERFKTLIDNIEGNIQEKCNKFSTKHRYYRNVLEMLVSSCSVEYIEMFVEDFKFDPSVESYGGMLLLHIAVAQNSYDMVEYLLKFIKDINLKYRDYFEYDDVGNDRDDILTILQVAKTKKDPSADIIELLIENGARE